ncbi:MAG TPA: NAD-dependent epimerase/dehydratase family protein [Acidimicrobiia bacterium]|jgi:dihydroflavonol-4-reductase|nr:NAD-dependent epimerase/dehydratase family protein [Acidimicrobiia bacterium]
MTVAITGATGVVGSAVLGHLLADGQKVRALVRSDQLLPPEVERVRGDVLDPASLRRAFEGVTTVFHVAGVNQMCSADPSFMERVNVDGTRNVADAAYEAGALLVHTSSAAVLGENEGEIGDESSVPRAPLPSRYAASKWRAEQELTELFGRQPVVIVNPSSVQGPGRATGTGRLLLRLMGGKLRTIVDTRISIVDIDDCAHGHLLAGTRGEPGQRYILNSFSMTTQEAVSVIESVIAHPLRVSYVPAPLVWTAGFVVGGLFKVLRRPAPICGESARAILHGHLFDGSRASRELGLKYTSADVIFGRLRDWAKKEGLL